VGQSDTQITVLVAEYDADVQQIICYTLRSYADNIIPVTDATDALTALEDVSPSLLFVDLNLPQLGSSGLMDSINDRLDSGDLRVIVTSSYSMRDLPVDLHPACGILKKPFDVAALRSVIEEQIARA